jgi:hypothetical protein
MVIFLKAIAVNRLPVSTNRAHASFLPSAKTV